MENFTPLSSLAGGALIGLASALLWIGSGRIAGVSGILGNLGQAVADNGWRLAFIVGLIVSPLIYASMAGRPAISISNGPAMLVAAGLLVGYGTRLGGGCTSGHGVCGLARLSARSMTATAIFMVAAAGTVFVTRHVIAG